MRFFLFVPVFILLLSCHKTAVVEQTDDMAPDAEQYFLGWFNKEVAERLHVSDPGYCFRRIRETVPKQWWRYAVESLYYRLPEIKDDGLTERWLDTALLLLPDEKVLSFVQLIRGCRLTDMGRYASAIPCLEESYQLAIQQQQPFRAHDAKRYLGRCYTLKGDYPKASVILMSVFDFLQDKPDVKQEVRKYETMLELARVYQTSGDYQKALRWSRAGLEYAHQFPNPGQEVEASESIGHIFLQLNHPDSAFQVLRASEAIRDAAQVRSNESNGNYLMGKALTSLGKYREALPKLKLAISGNLETFNRFKIAETQASLADCCMGLGLLDTALLYYRNALEKTPDTCSMGVIHYKISGIYEKKGAIKAALTHHQLGAHCMNIFNRREKNREIGRLESYNILEREKKQVLFLTEQHKIQQYKLSLLLLLLFTTIGTAMTLTKRNKRRHLMLQQEKELLEAKQLIQKQQIQLSKVALSEKELEVLALQKILDLKNNLIAALEQPTVLPENPNDVTMPLRPLTESEWDNFHDAFMEQYPGYSQRLINQFPRVTKNEIRLFIFIKIGLENGKIAEIFGISPESVYRNRTRLRQKLGLDGSVNLEHFVRSF
jgi:tetratricopeptide (TPR) repeat protein/DNA-binding CsgD family transcriptional regulator